MHGVLALPDTIYFPTSAGIEMCINEYMKQIAAELNGEELAVIVPASMPAQRVEGPLPKPENVAVAKAGPGHLYLCGHACILGALHATKVSTQKLLDSDTAPVAVWTEEFKCYSQSAAASMTPVGGYVLRECMKSTEVCNEEVPLGMAGDDQTPQLHSVDMSAVDDSVEYRHNLVLDGLVFLNLWTNVRVLVHPQNLQHIDIKPP